FYGTDNISFTFTSDEFNGITKGADGQVRPVVSRTFNSFSQAAEENGQSRIYLGIHWAFDKTEGIRTGDQIANFIFNRFLRPSGGANSTSPAANDRALPTNAVAPRTESIAASAPALPANTATTLTPTAFLAPTPSESSSTPGAPASAPSDSDSTAGA